MATRTADRDPMVKPTVSGRHKPLTLPDQKKKMRRAAVRARNAARAAARARERAGARARWAWDWVGTKYKCLYCERMVLNRRYKQHNPPCRWRYLEQQKKDAEKKQGGQNGSQNGPPDPPPERKPGQTKQKNRKQQGANMPGQQRGRGRQNGNGNGNGSGSGGSGGGKSGVRPSNEAANLLQAFQAWVNADPRTLAELKAHQQGMDTVMQQVGPLMEEYAQKLINRKFHPMIAQPIIDAGEGFVGIGHFFTDSILAFEQVYKARLEHERQGGPKPDQNDPVFNEVD